MNFRCSRNFFINLFIENPAIRLNLDFLLLIFIYRNRIIQ